jgi:parallel beta-helix repeat protein
MQYNRRNHRSSGRVSNRLAKSSVPLCERFSMFELLENRTLLSTYQVTTTADSGPGSLRDAITQANANAGADTITFALGGSGMQVINLSSALPAVTDSVTIDASASMVGGVPQVEINGGGLNVDGLDLMAANSSVVGLSIVGFGGAGIMAAGGHDQLTNDWIGVGPDGSMVGNGEGVVFNSDDNTLQSSVISANQDVGVTVSGDGNQVLNNMIGMDATGEVAMGNQSNGVDLVNATNSVVRGNVISSNGGNGIRIASSSLNTVAGNMIGTDVTGTIAMGNDGNGVVFDTDAANNTVGGSTAADRNIISGNIGNGIEDQDGAGAGNLVTGNYIGTDVSGFQALGNFGDGITVFGNGVTVSQNVISGNLGNGLSLFGDSSVVTNNIIGAAADGQSQLTNFSGGGFSDGLWVEGNSNVIGMPGEGNVIAYNSGSGIEVFMGAQNSIRGNSMFDNANLGIDLGADGNTLNDSSGHDGTNNNFQDYPLITTLTNTNGVLTATGTMDEDPDATYTIDLYSTDSSTADDHGQGSTWLGSVTVTTDDSGHATFSLAISDSSIPSGDTYIIGTATDSIGNTSEFGYTAAIPAATQVNANTSTTLSSSSDPSIVGQNVTFTAIVTPMSGTLAATGTVDFFEVGPGGVQTLLGSGTLSSGVATFSISTLAVGDNEIVASYEGAQGFNASQSAQLDQVVSQDVTTTLLSSSTTVSNPGQAVSFTAVISPAHSFSGVVSGTVDFFDVSPSGVRTLLGEVTVSGNQAVLTTTTLSVGTHNVVAVYNGNSDLQGSTSNTVSETVKAPVTLGTVSGTVYNDTTGNGLSSDDTGLSGVTVKLYKDSNNNGVLDSSDQVVATAVTGANGTYSFGSLAAGKYFVAEVTPTGYVRTAPATATYYTEAVNGQSITSVNFDNYKTCTCSSNVTNITYVIDGCKTVTDLRGQTHQGDTVQVKFTVLANHSVTLSFMSYTAPDNYFNANDASEQAIYNYETNTFTAGSKNTTFSMTIKLPKCDYQVDFVCGQVINTLGPAGSNIFYTQQDRLFSADNGGTQAPVNVIPIGETWLS